MSYQRKFQGFVSQIAASVHYRNFTEEQLYAYFTKDDSRKRFLSKVAFGTSIAFLIASFVWFTDFPWLAGISLLSILVGTILRIVIKLGIKVPTDEEYDTWVLKKAEKELHKALEEVGREDLSIAERKRILVVRGYAVPGTKDAKKYLKEDILWKDCRDGFKRYSINLFTYVLPLEHRLVAMTFHINAVNHRDHSQNIGEYFYNAIVSVRTVDDNEQMTIEEVDYLYRTKSFRLDTNDGNNICVTIRSLPIARVSGLPDFGFIDSNVEETIRKLRKHIRDIKEQGA